MKEYELFLVFNGRIDEEKSNELLEIVKSILVENKAEINDIKKLGKKKLAYPMKYQKEGYCLVMTFTAPSTTVPASEPKLRIIEDIYRSIFTVKK